MDISPDDMAGMYSHSGEQGEPGMGYVLPPGVNVACVMQFHVGSYVHGVCCVQFEFQLQGWGARADFNHAAHQEYCPEVCTARSNTKSFLSLRLSFGASTFLAFGYEMWRTQYTNIPGWLVLIYG